MADKVIGMHQLDLLNKPSGRTAMLISDIARALAYQPRRVGATREFYSVVPRSRMMRGDRSHVIAVVKTQDGTLPLLFVDGPAGGGQVALVRYIAGQGYSPSQQMKLTESIGRFCDWMQLAEAGTVPAPEILPAILRRFLVARYEGTVRSDPTGLFWKPVKAQTVEMDRRHLNKLFPDTLQFSTEDRRQYLRRRLAFG